MTALKLTQIGNSVGLVHGRRLVTPQAEATWVMRSLAAGTLDEHDFARWLCLHILAR